MAKTRIINPTGELSFFLGEDIDLSDHEMHIAAPIPDCAALHPGYYELNCRATAFPHLLHRTCTFRR